MLIVADDLIWSSRLAALARAAGVEPSLAASEAGLAERLAADPSPRLAVVDLTARGYDPLRSVGTLAARGVRVVCVGRHDDPATRKAALAAGAAQVLAYRKLADDGPAVMRSWLEGAGSGG